MKRNGAIIASAIIIALALIYCGKNITNAINSSGDTSIAASSSQGILMKEADAAKYLGIKAEDFKEIIKEDLREKQNLGAYPTYKFIPYIVIKGERYYSRAELDKWVEFNMLNK